MPKRRKWFQKPSDIKVGVIGYGGAFNMGRKHLEEMRKAGMRPYAVTEIDPERLAVAREDFPGIETYDSVKRMLRESAVDLIVHITPHNLHYPLAAQCLRAGKHVVTEKPFVVTTSEADRLIKLADERKLVVSTYHNRHWDGWVLRAVREIRDKGVIGELRRVDAWWGGYGMPKDWWRTSKTISGGVAYDWGVHLLEYCLQVIDDDLVEVAGFHTTGHWAAQMKPGAPWKHDCNEDELEAVARFAKGARLDLRVSTIDAVEKPYILGFHGTRGSYTMDFKTWSTRIAKRGGGFSERSGEHPPGKQHLYYRNLAAHLCGEEELVITPQWARRPIHILDLADRSARRGRALRARYP